MLVKKYTSSTLGIFLVNNLAFNCSLFVKLIIFYVEIKFDVETITEK